MNLNMDPMGHLNSRAEMAESIARNLRDEAAQLEADAEAMRIEMEKWFAKAEEFRKAAIHLTYKVPA